MTPWEQEAIESDPNYDGYVVYSAWESWMNRRMDGDGMLEVELAEAWEAMSTYARIALYAAFNDACQFAAGPVPDVVAEANP